MRQQEKEALQVRIQQIESELTSQLLDWKKLGRQALWIGGSLGALYWIIQSIQAEDDYPASEMRSPTSTDDEPSVFWSVAQGVATSVLLAVAKQALMQLIQKLPAADETE